MKPFQSTLKKYVDIFAGQEMYFVNDNRNLQLFAQNPSNTSLEDIRTKLSAINDTDIRNHLLMDEMAAHILSLNIDDRLRQGDVTLVDDIANITAQGKSHHLLHFASVYCNLHRPDVFPIYSEQHFDFYRKYISEYNLPLDAEKLDTYDVFSKALDDLLNRLKLKGKMNYLHIRKFGWAYADVILKESGNFV